MAEGGGPYDDVASLVRALTAAEAVFVFVGGGRRGSHFAVHYQDPGALTQIARILRESADKIEADVARMQGRLS